MAPISMLFGVLLILLGGGLFFTTDPRAYTALIPAYFGFALLILGVVARSEAARKHAMHLAAMVGLVGCVIPAYRVIGAVIAGTEMGKAHYSQIAMAVLCGVFLALCVKSFIDVRRARKAKEAQAA